MAANHPDVMQVKPERSTLKIAQIRALCDVLALKPFEARVRVVIISDAHAMSPAAANALLKMLEEPPSRTVLILIAPQRSDLLPTVVSRCQCVRFNPIPAAAIAARLTEEHGIGPNAARILATVAEGSLARARALAASDWLSYRSWLIAATGLATGPKTVSQDTGRLLAVAERLSADKQLAADSLATLLTWLRDVIVCRLDPGRVINTDLRDELRSASQQVDAPTILGRMEAVRTAQKNLAANANLRLTLEVMMLKLAAH
jgi:DNA polymerase-3 subunit delta'